jgi:hypothetical protein
MVYPANLAFSLFFSIVAFLPCFVLGMITGVIYAKKIKKRQEQQNR